MVKQTFQSQKTHAVPIFIHLHILYIFIFRRLHGWMEFIYKCFK